MKYLAKLRHQLGYFFISVMLSVVMVGCGSKSETAIQRIALLASFEGRFSEVGYDAYFAGRMAIQDHGNDTIELLAIDDGGSKASAVERAKALTRDPLIKVVIVMGNNASSEDVQQALGDVPVMIVGNWNSKRLTENVYVVSSAKLQDAFTAGADAIDIADADSPLETLIGGDILALKQFASISKHRENVTIASSATLPDTQFRERYLTSGQFVPEPGLLASITYDAFGMALMAMENQDVPQALATLNYEGLNGTIQFVDGYWASAPIHYYQYAVDGQLTPVDRPIK